MTKTSICSGIKAHPFAPLSTAPTVDTQHVSVMTLSRISLFPELVTLLVSIMSLQLIEVRPGTSEVELELLPLEPLPVAVVA